MNGLRCYFSLTHARNGLGELSVSVGDCRRYAAEDGSHVENPRCDASMFPVPGVIDLKSTAEVREWIMVVTSTIGLM